ncbi:MAG: GIY-YIG nuclease family protein [Vicinamibacterales bacterium]
MVYILRCADDALYVGETTDIGARMARHKEGGASRFTSLRRPVTLAFAEAHGSRTAALTRERQIKRWTRAKKEALIAGDLASRKRL